MPLYVRHLTTADKLSLLIDQAEASENVDLGEYERCLKMREKEVRAASSLATRMRITQQAYTIRPGLGLAMALSLGRSNEQNDYSWRQAVIMKTRFGTYNPERMTRDEALSALSFIGFHQRALCKVIQPYMSGEADILKNPLCSDDIDIGDLHSLVMLKSDLTELQIALTDPPGGRYADEERPNLAAV